MFYKTFKELEEDIALSDSEKKEYRLYHMLRSKNAKEFKHRKKKRQMAKHSRSINFAKAK
jgi:hypothetical protein